MAFLEGIDKELKDIERSPMNAKEKEKSIDKLQKKFNDAQTKHAKETLRALFGEPTENRSFDIKYEERDKYGNKKPSKRDRNDVKEVVEDAMRHVQGILDDLGIEYKNKKGLLVFTQPNNKTSQHGRDDYGNGILLMCLKSDGGIVGMPLKLNPFEGTVHEIIHEIVYNNPLLQQKLKRLLDHDSPLLPSYYCAKEYSQNDRFPQELLPMFFTCLISDTSLRHDMDVVVRTGTEFASKFPDYFNGIMNILRGLKK